MLLVTRGTERLIPGLLISSCRVKSAAWR